MIIQIVNKIKGDDLVFDCCFLMQWSIIYCYVSLGIGMDACITPIRHGGLSLVQTTSIMYTLIDDPYMMVCVLLNTLFYLDRGRPENYFGGGGNRPFYPHRISHTPFRFLTLVTFREKSVTVNMIMIHIRDGVCFLQVGWVLPSGGWGVLPSGGGRCQRF